MSTVGFSKGNSSATHTSFRGDGILANYGKGEFKQVISLAKIIRDLPVKEGIDYE